jgi:hypothetical protein
MNYDGSFTHLLFLKKETAYILNEEHAWTELSNYS